MIRAFSFPVSPERGRLRGWLEGSLAGLCELHWLRERQEYRVQQALRLAQPGMGGAEAEDEEDAEEDEDAAAARRAAAALEEQLVRGSLSVHPSAPVCVYLSVCLGRMLRHPFRWGRGRGQGVGLETQEYGRRAGRIWPPRSQTGEGGLHRLRRSLVKCTGPFPKENSSGC